VTFERWHRTDGVGDVARKFAGAAALTVGSGVLVGGFLGTTLNHTHWERVK
jgi:hypothetical protein